MNPERLKFYTILAGQLTYRMSSSAGGASTCNGVINVCEHLDWKRQFAVHLWYHSLPIHSISDALAAYEQSVHAHVSNKPLPPYIEDSVSLSAAAAAAAADNAVVPADQNQKATTKELYDTCYHLIKLYSNSAHPIEHIISPLSHTANQLDFRLRLVSFGMYFSASLIPFFVANFTSFFR
jgi:nuclear pore complex protein Nup98-Nup96